MPKIKFQVRRKGGYIRKTLLAIITCQRHKPTFTCASSTESYLQCHNFYGRTWGADMSLARPGRKKLMFLSEWREFPSAPYLAGKQILMTALVSMLLKSCASLICFRACFLPGRDKDLSAPRYLFSSRWRCCLQREEQITSAMQSVCLQIRY